MAGMRRRVLAGDRELTQKILQRPWVVHSCQYGKGGILPLNKSTTKKGGNRKDNDRCF